MAPYLDDMPDADAQPVILIQDLRKNFGDFHALQGLSLHVNRGEIYGLLGPNGAGKTTALRLLAGLLTPTAGHVSVAGIDVASRVLEARRQLGFLTGSAGLYARLTGREVLAHTAALHGFERERIDQRIRLLEGDLDLHEFLDVRCGALSTGQRQRVSLARALVHDPAALILDEPTSGLDVLASQGLRSLILREKARGKGILMSTHYLAEAELLCDRIGFLHQGALISEGSPRALREQTGTNSLEEAFLQMVRGQAQARPDDDGVSAP